MRKIFIVILVVFSALCFAGYKFYFVSEGEVGNEPEAIKANEDTNEIVNEPTQINEFKAGNNTTKVVADVEDSPEIVAEEQAGKKSVEAQAYEDALSKLVDRETFEKRTTNVFSQYASEEQTPSSITLQGSVQEKFYSSGSYDELLKQGVQLSSVRCKKTLCKIDFNLSNQTESSMDAGFFITQTLVENFVSEDGAPKISSQEKDGELHFYIGSDALIK